MISNAVELINRFGYYSCCGIDGNWFDLGVLVSNMIH